jgi:hypothetical protein
MTIFSKDKPAGIAGAAAPFTLADVETALQVCTSLSETRRRDLVSAVRRVAALIGDEPARLSLDLAMIQNKLNTTNPVAVGITAKSYANIRSNFLAAVKASGLKETHNTMAVVLAAAWDALLASLPERSRIGLSRLARHASALQIEPAGVNTDVLEGSSRPCTRARYTRRSISCTAGRR